MKKSVFKIYRKTFVLELLLMKLQSGGLQLENSKKRLQHRCFPVNFAKFLRTPFFQSTSGCLLLYSLSFLFSSYAVLFYILFTFTCLYFVYVSETNNLEQTTPDGFLLLLKIYLMVAESCRFV